MPFVNIKVTQGGVTAEQKQELIRGVTQLLADVLGKDPKTTFVVIDEVGAAINGKPDFIVFPRAALGDKLIDR